MPAPRTYRTEAVVIKHSKLGEADKIVTLYTPELGKVRAVAKGVRRPGSKLSGHVDLLTHSQLLLAHGRNLDIVTQAQTIDSLLPMKNDLARISCGFYVAELVDCFTEERMHTPRVFDLLVDTLRRLCQARDTEQALRYFELHLVDALGYRPQLRTCAICNTALEPVTNFFHPASGGVICPSCSYDKPYIRPLTLNAFKVLRLWQDCDFDTASRVLVNPELRGELEMVMRGYIRFLLEREVKSTSWLDQLRRDDLSRAAPSP